MDQQNLRIKHFFGTIDNAVKTQVWNAICFYVLVAIIRKELRLQLSLSQILQVLCANVFEQAPPAELAMKTALRNQFEFNTFQPDDNNLQLRSSWRRCAAHKTNER